MDHLTTRAYRRTRLYQGLALVSIIAVLVILSLPGEWIEDLRTRIHPWLPWSSDLVPSDFPADKLVHAVLFALCAALVVRGWTTLRERWWLVCGLLVAYGAVTEVIQRYVPGRSAALEDLLADATGVAVGVAFALRYLRGRAV